MSHFRAASTVCSSMSASIAGAAGCSTTISGAESASLSAMLEAGIAVLFEESVVEDFDCICGDVLGRGDPVPLIPLPGVSGPSVV